MRGIVYYLSEIISAIGLFCLAFCPIAQGVVSARDGTHPGGDVAESQKADGASDASKATTGDSAQEELIRVDTGTNEEFNKRWKAPAQSRSASIQDSDEMAFEQKQISTTANLAPAVKELFSKNEESAHKARKSSPSPAISPFMPSTGSCVDPMIAVGEKHMIVSDTSTMWFLNKQGKPEKKKPHGIELTWEMTDFFKPMLDAANAGSFSWLGVAPINPLCNPRGHECDPEAHAPHPDSLCSAYDTRVIYEPVNKRFIIVSAIRNMVWRDAAGCPAVRIFGFAVSNSEDPQDGFKMWYWTKSNYRDWPRVSADKDVVTVMHGLNSGDDGSPVIYAISMKDLLEGVSHPHWFTYLQGDDGVPSSNVTSVAKFGGINTTFDDYVMFLQADGNKAVLYYYKKSANMWTNKPELKQAYITLDNPISLSWQDRPVYRNGNIYFTSIVQAYPGEVNTRPPLNGFYLYRLPLKMDGNDIAFHSDPHLLSYPVLPPSPTSTEFTSYDIPSLSVDSKGTMLVAYGRLAKTSTGFIFPESRYFVFFANENKHRLSQPLMAGQFMPRFTPVGWTKQTIDGFDHYSEQDTEDWIDYSTVTADPKEISTFWIAHAFADKMIKSYRMVVGKVQAK